MGLNRPSNGDNPSLEPVRRKPVIANAATGILGAYVVRARQDSDSRPQGQDSHASGQGLKLKLTKKTQSGAQKNAKGKKQYHNTSVRHHMRSGGGCGLTEAEQQQLAMQSHVAEEKARRYEAIERGEIAASDDYNVDFSKRAPPEPAHRRSPARSSSPDANMDRRSPEPRWEAQRMQRRTSHSPPPDPGYPTARHDTRAHQRASPVYDTADQQPQQRASPTYEPYRPRSQERGSPDYAPAGEHGRRRRAGLGYGAKGHEDDEYRGSSPDEERDRTKQRHYQEFMKRQEQWQRADDEKQRQRDMLKEALPAEQDRIKRVMAQAAKQRDEDAALQERLVEMMMAKAKAERKAKKKASKKK